MKRFLLIIVVLFFKGNIPAQIDSDSSSFERIYKTNILYTIKTNFGTTHIGYIISETKTEIILETENKKEQIKIFKNEIVSVTNKKSNDKYKTDVLGENDHPESYMTANASFLYKEGSSKTNTYYFLYQNTDFALSENFAVSLGSFLFYPLAFGVHSAFKINETNYFGFDGNLMGNIFPGTAGSTGFYGYTASAKYTHGTGNKNLTISAGVLGLNSELIYSSSSFSLINIPYVCAAYCSRFAEHFAINGELWLFPLPMVALTGVGFKYLHSDKIAWTFGCYTNIEDNNNNLNLNLKTLPIPFLSYTRKLN